MLFPFNMLASGWQ